MQKLSGILFGVTAALLLAGCNENNTSMVGSPSRLTLTPALGQVFKARVRLSTLNGRSIASGVLENGQATLEIPFGISGPFLATVCGGTGVTYFDEALRAEVPLAATQCLRALVPDSTGRNATLSVLSESVVRYFERHGGLAQARPVDIRLRQAALADQLGLDEATALGLPPSRVGSTADLLALQRRYTGVDGATASPARADRYAYLLAGLSEAGYLLARQRGETPAAPALAVADQLAADLSDGILDGKDADAYLVSPVYDGLRMNTLLADLMKIQLKSQLGDALPELDLNTQAGLDYLQANRLRQPFRLKVTRSLPDDSLLSWQGQYTGKWHLGGNIEAGRQNAWLLPEAYRSYMSQLVEGEPCTVMVSDQAVSLSGLPFATGPLVRGTPDESGVRQFGLSRTDTGLVRVEAVGGMQTRADRVVKVSFTVRASSFGLKLDAQVACVVSP